MSDGALLVRERIRSEHSDLLRTVADCAAAVAAGWEGGDATDGGTTNRGTTNRDVVVPPFRAALDRAGALDRLPALLHTAAATLDTTLPAEPVAAPPYVVVTATGPVVRATFPHRGRLVIEVEVFAVERDGAEPRYRLIGGEHGDRVGTTDLDSADLLSVTFR